MVSKNTIYRHIREKLWNGHVTAAEQGINPFKAKSVKFEDYDRWRQSYDAFLELQRKSATEFYDLAKETFSVKTRTEVDKNMHDLGRVMRWWEAQIDEILPCAQLRAESEPVKPPVRRGGEHPAGHSPRVAGSGQRKSPPGTPLPSGQTRGPKW